MGFLKRLLRLIRTLRYVPRRALLWRVRARLVRLYYMSPLYGLAGLGQAQDGAVKWVGVELFKGSEAVGREIAAGKWTFAGRTQVLGVPVRDWLPAGMPALWIFNLHYHEWLADLRAAGKRDEAQALVAAWMVRFGHYHPVVWHPYPTSLRLVAWLTHGAWLLEGADAEMAAAFRALVRKQAGYLADNREHDLGGNHLLKNLKAMIYSGLAVEGLKEVYAAGLAGFLREMADQIMADGSHFERSPMYMAQVLRDVLEVRAVLRNFGGAPKVFDEAARRLGAAVDFFRHGDGRLGLFNDGAEMDETYLRQLVRLAGADEAATVLPDSGYARLQRGKTLLLFDAGKVGPDENPGHAHADTLSFEMSSGEERVVVNGGTYAYQDRLRNVLRGTPAHSTVSLDGGDSAEVWGGFRVGRRPKDVTLKVSGAEEGGEVVAEGQHDGYRHLGATHRRKLVVAGDGSRVRGEDEITFKGRAARVMAHFHLHPDVAVRLVSDGEAELTLKSGARWKVVAGSGRLDVKESRYAPQFGVLLPTKQLVLHGRAVKRVCRLDWQLQNISV